MKRLGDLLDYLQPGPFIVSSDFYSDEYPTPVLTAGKSFLLGYTNDKSGIYPAKANPIILFDDFTTASQWVDFDFKVKSSACKILVPKPGVDLRYVFHAMQAIRFDATEHKRYWIKDYSQIQIPYPEKPRRDLAVTVLDGILGQIEAFRSGILLLDEQVKSLFNDMFGNLSTRPLGQFVDFFSGYAFKSDRFTTKGAPIIRISNIQNGEIDVSDLVFYPELEVSSLERYTTKKNDVLIAMSGATTGKVAIIRSPDKFYINQRVGCFRSKSGLMRNEFLYAFLNTDAVRNAILSASSGCAQPNISGNQLKELEIPFAPLVAQNQFVEKLEQIDKLRFNCQRQIEVLQELMDKKTEEFFGNQT